MGRSRIKTVTGQHAHLVCHGCGVIGSLAACPPTVDLGFQLLVRPLPNKMETIALVIAPTLRKLYEFPICFRLPVMTTRRQCAIRALGQWR